MTDSKVNKVFSQVDESAYDREEEYRLAQRAAIESIIIGRETLESAIHQGEQLQNAENLADETEYKLDRAARLLKGMSWTGWLANKFSSDIEPPEYRNAESPAVLGPPRVYEEVPPHCSEAAQAIQNYHCNIDVLEECETDEQRDTCVVICNNMYRQAHSQLKQLLLKDGGDKESRKLASQLQADLATLRERQQSSQRLTRTPTSTKTQAPQKADLFQAPSVSYQSTKSPLQNLQEDHLDVVARQLNELGSLATNLNASLAHHADTLETLDQKMESNLVKSNNVTRRTDRLIQKKKWRKIKPIFVGNYAIRHINTKKYFSVSTKGTIVLSSKFNETCIFGVWKRQGIFGLKSEYAKRFIGQNLIGNLVCTAIYFDKREEWDADGDDWSNTPLICASANWGNGGYLQISSEDGSISIIGGAVEDRGEASLWCMIEQDTKDDKSTKKKL